VLRPDEVFPAGRRDARQRHLSLSSGVRVRIVEGGVTSGPPIVFVPGWGASAYMFRHAFDELVPLGMRLIVIEQRGFGFSDRPRARGAYTYAQYERDLLDVLDVLALDRVTLVGQSMGGGLALRFALRHPERLTHMVLINPSGLIPLRFIPPLRVVPRVVARLLGRRLVPRALIGFTLRRIAYGDATKVTERDIDEYWAPTQIEGYVYAARATLSEFDWRAVSDAEAASLAVPTLVILGEADRLIRNSTGAAVRLAGATVCVLPGGHCVHEELPHAAYRRIAEFVAR
jgi:pimeloyl-ACP methyl ester carboxylesterase